MLIEELKDNKQVLKDTALEKSYDLAYSIR